MLSKLWRSGSWRTLAVFAVAAWTFEFVAFSDFDGAQASDLDMVRVGGSSSSGGPPPNILFLFDSSGSMNNLVCDDSAPLCDSSHMQAKSVPNSATVCENSVFVGVQGPSKAGTGAGYTYQGVYGSDATTYSGSVYPIFDPRKSGPSDDYYPPGTVYSTGGGRSGGMTEIAVGSGATDKDQIDSAIATACATASTCEQQSRCIYSLRTQGYFWEPSGSSCGAGDPMAMCSGGGGSSGALGDSCDASNPCQRGFTCVDGVCSECANDSDCPGRRNYCRDSSCEYSYCSDNGCSLPTGGSGSSSGSLTARILLGDFLNFYPPKGIGLIGAFSRTIHNMKGDARIGVSDFSDVGTGDVRYQMFPPCAQVRSPECFDGDPATQCFNPDHQALENYLYNQLTFNSYTPLAKALDNAGDYYSGGSYGRGGGSTAGAGDLGANCRRSSDCNDPYVCNSNVCSTCRRDWNCNGSSNHCIDTDCDHFYCSADGCTATTTTTGGGGGGGNSPICDYSSISSCGEANSFVVIITDGMPSQDATRATDLPYSNAHAQNFSDAYASDNSQWVDDVAKVLAESDLATSITGTQAAFTYAVSYGLVDPTDSSKCVGLLDETATAGQGRCIPATSVDQLQEALETVVSEIIRRALGFTAPSVPTTRVSGEASLGTAVFRPAATFPLWEGHVFGFKICDEAAARLTGTSCTCPNGTTPNDVCVVNANGGTITYDDEGYLDANSEPLWDAQLCLSGDIDSTYGAKVPDPWSLNVSSCYRSADETASNARDIFTAVDKNNTSTLTGDDQIAFTAANVDAESTFLSALDVGGDADLGKNVVKFFRGYDVSDVDADGDRSEERNLSNIQDPNGDLVEGWWKLGDIFHSIPNIVERPDGRGVGAWANTESYKGFEADYTARDRVILVGANDGMLHAFRAGTWDATMNAGQGDYKTIDSADGGGEELWAFVSPELLPTLKSSCDPTATSCSLGDYSFKADGSVMVRDIWIGGASDDINDAAKKSLWRTIAVYGHRRGGLTYVALDITDVNAPTLLWQFPQPSQVVPGTSTQVMELMGQSWLDVYPAPASIGALKVRENGTETYKWVVLLSGGYDPTDTKGRALFIVDAATGDILWARTRSNTSDMKYSFPGTPGFYASFASDKPYIAGIVAVDHGGQVWHIDTSAAATISGGVITNFTPRIVFRTLASPISPDPEANHNGVVDSGEYQTHPFFFIPTVTMNSGKKRLILGTGDRDMLIPPADATTALKDHICGVVDIQRLYAFDIPPLGASAYTEDDLTEVKDSTRTYALPSSKGWFMQLSPGEKVATPYEAVGGYALYATFMPSASVCGASGASSLCTTDSKGEARLYVRHYLTGEPLDWNGDGAITDEPSFIVLGAGVPTAPSVSTSVAGGVATSTIFAGGSDSGLISRQFGSGSVSLVGEIMLFPVSRELHDVIHQGK